MMAASTKTFSSAAGDFPALFSETAKVVVRPEDAEIARAALEGIDVMIVSVSPETGRIAVVGRDGGGEMKPVVHLPAGIALVWGRVIEMAKALHEDISVLGAVDGGAVVSGGAADLLRRLTGVLARNADVFRIRAAELSRALVEVRLEAEQTRVAMHRIQDIIWAVRSAPAHQSFITALSSRTVAAGVGAEERRIVQKLPVPALGLAGIDIFVAELPTGDGHIRAALTDPADGSALVRWVVPYASLERGWLTFAPPYVLEEDIVTLELEFVASGHDTRHPSLSLAGDQFAVMPALYAFGEIIPGTMLALRVWSSYPGLKNPICRPWSLWENALRGLRYKLPLAALRPVRRLREYQADFNYLVLHENGDLLLHPLRNITADAIIPRAVPPHASRLEAVVSINGDCPNPVQFALVVLPRGANPLHVTPNMLDQYASSGWQEVPKPFSRHTIGLQLVPSSEPQDILLFTRVRDGHSLDWAQATFHELIVTVDSQRALLLTDTDHTEALSDTPDETPQYPGLEPASGYAVTPEPMPEEAIAPIVADIQAPEPRISHEPPEPDAPPVPQAGFTYVLSAEQYNGLRPMLDFDTDTPFVRPLSQGAAMIHPLPGVTNIGMLPRLVPPEVRQIEADVYIPDERCTIEIEFGLAVSQAETADPHHFGNRATRRSLRQGDGRVTLVLDLDGERDGNMNLYFMTRAVNSSTVDFGTAIFENVRFLG